MPEMTASTREAARRLGVSDTAFARRALEASAVGTGLTYDQVAGDLTQANYSSLRAGKIEFRRLCEQV
jgi:capsid protein